jgi:hypothetical protein
MSTDTRLPSTDIVTERERPSVTSVLVVLAGGLAVLAGSLVLFAASPAMPVEPFFDVSPVEPVSITTNMAVGATVVVAGTAVSVPELDDIL